MNTFVGFEHFLKQAYILCLVKYGEMIYTLDTLNLTSYFCKIGILIFVCFLLLLATAQ